MSKIPVTVLMPAYNTENYIAEAIESVLKQTFTDFELLIVNDGSADGTEAVIRSFKDDRIVLVNRPNGGVSAALNTGLGVARGEYIARFDADDVCYPERLQEQYQFMKANPDYILIGSDAVYGDKNGAFLFYYRNIGHTNEEINERMSLHCPFIHATVFYKKETVIKLGGYEPRAHTFEDYLLWVKLVKAGKVMNMEKPLVHVRLNPESVTVDDRLRGKEFINLKKEIIFGNTGVTAEQEQKLLSILKSQNFSRFKQYSYYILVAKKCLWNSHQPAKARESLKKALSYKPFSLTAWGLMALTRMPGSIITYFYKTFKSTQ